jgi:hypothetical protein
MRGMGLLSSIREKLIKAGVNANELQWVDFTDPDSLNKLAQKIMPNLLKNNPQIARQIKESGWLDWKTKEDVAEVIDSI